MALSIQEIALRVDRLRVKYAERDTSMSTVLEARKNNYAFIAPEMLPEGMGAPLVANQVDVFARDIAEKIAPLPTISCSSGSMVSDRAKTFSDKRTKIANHYVSHSRLKTQMYSGVDWYVTFSFVPFYIEPDFDAKLPRIRMLMPIGTYPEYDRWGNCVALAEVMKMTVHELCLEYPEFEGQIKGNIWGNNKGDTKLDLVKWTDADQVVLYLPQRNWLVLNKAKNYLGKCPVVVARRPGFERGQFDDIVWVQIARAVMAAYTLEGAKKSVEAPLALPDDATELALGSDAVIRTRSPEKVRRIPLELPQGVFAESQQLSQEMQLGARASASGNGVQANVITGRGIQELNSAYDSQITTAQEVLTEVFRQVFSLCFEMDEKLWPSASKQISGNTQGAPYDLSYVPSRDINGDYKVDVSYGFAAGLDPNRAVVMMLQLRGDKLISREQFQRQLPWDMNVTEENMKVDIEELRDAAKQGVFGMVQAIPAMAAQGGDPSQIVSKIAGIIKGRQKGKSIEDLISEAFPPPPPPSPDDGMGQPPADGSGAPGPDGELPPGMQPSGLLQGVAPGQAGMPAGGRPSVQQLMAGLSSSGAANMQASVAQRIPIQ
jgi:hypothetical protein